MTAPATEPRSSFARFRDAVAGAGRRFDERGNHLQVSCPVPTHGKGRGDRQPSVSVDWSPSGKVLLECKAGCHSDDIIAALGLRPEMLFDDYSAHPRTDRLGAGRSRAPRQRRTAEHTPVIPMTPLVEVPDLLSVVSELDRGDLGDKVGRARPVRDYIYRVADRPGHEGPLHGRVQRRLQRYQNGEKKTFAHYRWNQARGSWEPGAPSPLILFNEPQLLDAIGADVPVLVVEGEKDCETAADLGLVATTNPSGGTSKWADHPRWVETLRGAHLVIVPDRDKPGYQHALDVYAAVVDVVASVRLMVTAVGCKDLTDHVAAGHTADELVEVTLADVVRAVVALDLVWAARWISSRLVAGATATDLLGCDGEGLDGLLRGLARAVPDVAEPLRAARGSFGEVVAGRFAEAAPRETATAAGVRYRLSTPEYDIKQAMVCELTKRGQREQDAAGDWQQTEPDEWRVLVGCLARVVRVEHGDNGDEVRLDETEILPTRAYVLSWDVEQPDGTLRHLGVQRVEADKWDKGAWFTQSPAIGARITLPRTTSERARAADAVRMVSASLDTRTAVYTAPGWRRGDTGWFYVHGGLGSATRGDGQAITAHGTVDVRVAFDPAAAHIELPEPSRDQDEATEAFAEVFALVDDLPARMSVPLLALSACAVLGWVQTPVLLQGNKGSAKTSVGVVCAGALFDPTMPYDRPRLSLASTGSTALSIVNDLNKVNCAVALLDDSNPDKGLPAAAEIIAKLARHQHGQVERRRARYDGDGNSASGQPRGGMLMTAEMNAVAASASAQERIFEIPVGKSDLAPTHSERDVLLARLHARPRRLRRSRAVADLIQWAAGRYEKLLEERDRCTGRDDDTSYTRAFDAAGLLSRTATPAGHWAWGWRLWIEAALDHDAIDQQQADQLWQRGCTAILEAARLSQQASTESSYADRFRQFVVAGLAAGVGHLEHRTAGKDLPGELAMACGYAPDLRAMRLSGEADNAGGDVFLIVRGQRIGWVAPGERRVFLIPAVAVKLARDVAQGMGERFDVSETFLGAHLQEARLLQVQTNRDGVLRRKVGRRCGGALVPVWDMDLDWLLGPEPDDGNPGPDGLPPFTPPPSPWGNPDTAGADVDDTPTVHPDAYVPTIHPAPADANPAVSITSHRLEQAMVYHGQHPADVLRTIYLQRPRVSGIALPQCLACTEPCATVYGDAGVIALHIGCPPPAWLRFDAMGTIVEEPQAPSDDMWSEHDDEQVNTLAAAEHAAPATPTAAADHGAADGPLVAAHRQPADSTAPAPAPAPTGPVPGGTQRSAASATASAAGRRRAPARQRREPAQVRPAAVVVDVDGVYFPDGRVEALPDITHAGDLAAIAVQHQVGWRDPTRKLVPDAGQVWVTPALAAQLGLPAYRDREDGEDVFEQACAAAQPFIDAAQAAGWRVQTRGNGFAPWMEILPSDEDRTTAWIAFPGLLVGDSLRPPLLDGDPDPVALARRLQAYADSTGQTFLLSPGESGLRLLGKLRPRPKKGEDGTASSKKISQPDPVSPPPPLLDRRTAFRLVRWPFSWLRPLSADEVRMAYVIGYDVNRQFLPAAGAALLGLGEAEHRTGEITFDASLAALWLVRWCDNDWWGLPHILDPSGSRAAERARIEADRAAGDRSRLPTEWFWYPTPILAQAAEAGYPIEVREACVWPHATRYADPWYKALSGAIKPLLGSDVPDDAALLKTLQLTYKHGIGKLGEHARFRDLDDDVDKIAYRVHRHVNPHWQATIEAQAAANQWRGLRAISDTSGRQPVLVDADLVLYPADTPDPFAAAPAGMQIGAREGREYLKRNGAYKPKAVVPMSQYRDWLQARLAAAAEGRRGTPPLTELMTPETLWSPA